MPSILPGMRAYTIPLYVASGAMSRPSEAVNRLALLTATTELPSLRPTQVIVATLCQLLV